MKYTKTDSDGDRYHYSDREMTILHREDGPAVEWADGDRDWYLHGKRHREDGPAIEWADGTKQWYLHGKLHREDGPAVEWADGDKYWYLHGKRHSKEEFDRLTTDEVTITIEEIAKLLGVSPEKIRIKR